MSEDKDELTDLTTETPEEDNSYNISFYTSFQIQI